MTTQALCIGLSYPQGCNELGLPPLPSAVDSTDSMVSLATSVGADCVSTLTDCDGTPVTREDILTALENMVSNAQPGDQLLFSYAGHAGQLGPQAHAGDMTAYSEADGYNEVLWAADGPITDNELLAILKELPEGANMTMAFDSASSGSMADLDMGAWIPGNVVCISATADGEALTGCSNLADNMATVLAENPGISWAEAAGMIDCIDGTQTCTVSANRAELLGEPLFATGATTEEVDTGASLAVLSELEAAQAECCDSSAQQQVQVQDDGCDADCC